MDISNFFPPFAGVLLAFGVQWIYSWIQNRRKRRNLLIGVKKELEFVVQRLREEQLRRIERETLYEWISGVNSGTTQLLKHDIRERIGRLYFAIDDYDNEAELVMKFGGEYLQAKSASVEAPKERLWENRSQEIVTVKANLTKAIEDALKEEFWPR